MKGIKLKLKKKKRKKHKKLCGITTIVIRIPINGIIKDIGRFVVVHFFFNPFKYFFNQPRFKNIDKRAGKVY